MNEDICFYPCSTEKSCLHCFEFHASPWQRSKDVMQNNKKKISRPWIADTGWQQAKHSSYFGSSSSDWIEKNSRRSHSDTIWNLHEVRQLACVLSGAGNSYWSLEHQYNKPHLCIEEQDITERTSNKGFLRRLCIEVQERRWRGARTKLLQLMLLAQYNGNN